MQDHKWRNQILPSSEQGHFQAWSIRVLPYTSSFSSYLEEPCYKHRHHSHHFHHQNFIPRIQQNYMKFPHGREIGMPRAWLALGSLTFIWSPRNWQVWHHIIRVMMLELDAEKENQGTSISYFLLFPSKLKITKAFPIHKVPSRNTFIYQNRWKM